MPAAVSRNRSFQSHLKPAGYQQITSLGTAVGFTSIPDETQVVVVQAEAQAIRYRDDGVDPTATTGMVIAAGETVVFTNTFSTTKFIEAVAGGKLNISFYY